MKSFFGQTDQQQDAEIALYWGSLEAEANKRQRLQSCWELYLSGAVQSPLFVDSQRRTQAAIDWAYTPVFQSGDYSRREWLEVPGWETGVFAEHFVIIFPQIDFDATGNAVDVLALTLYDLDERPFGDCSADSIELDRSGNLIIEGELPDPARPLDVSLNYFLKGLDYMIAHNGRSQAEVEQTRRRVRERQQHFRNERQQRK